MVYDANDDPYIDKDTGILRNLLNITTQKQLDIAEVEITSVTIATLEFSEQPVF